MNPHPSATVPRRGYLFVVTAALLWAVSGSSGKYLFHQGMTPYQLVQLRLTLSTSVLALWLIGTRRHWLRIERRDIFYFMVLGIVGMAGVQFTYFYAISKIQVAAAILLEYLAPTFIALHAMVFLGERPTRRTLAAVLGATCGCYLVAGAYNLDLVAMNSRGIIAGVASGVAFAWYSVHGEWGMRRYHPVTVLFYALLFATLFWNVAHPPLEAFGHHYSAVEWGWILYIALLGTLVPFGLYFWGINLIRSTRASITATLEPIGAGLISYLFLDEILEPLQLFGGLLVIASVVILQLRQEQDDKIPDLIRTRGQENPS